PRVEAGHGGATRRQLFGVDDRALPAGFTERDDASQRGETCEVLRKLHPANHIQDEVNPFAIGGLQDLRGPVWLGIVDAYIRAQRQGEIKFRRGAGGSDDLPGFQESGELNGQRANAARRRLNENALPWLNVPKSSENVIGGQSLERKGHCLSGIQTRG